MGVCICGLVQPPTPPQRDQIRNAPPASQWSCQGYLPAASRGLRDRPQGQSNALEPYYPLLESAGRSVDKQANRRARSGRRATVDQGRLNGSQGVTSFLKIIAAPRQASRRRCAGHPGKNRSAGHWTAVAGRPLLAPCCPGAGTGPAWTGHPCHRAGSSSRPPVAAGLEVPPGLGR